MVKRFFTILFTLFIVVQVFAQKEHIYTHADTLRGKLSPERSCYNVYFYNLQLVINPGAQYIQGHNTIYFKAESDFDKMQVDLFRNMVIDSVVHHNEQLSYVRDSNAVFIKFSSLEKKGAKDSIKICYHGNPQVAKKPPWDGGFVWSKDSLGNPWIGVACEGTGASLWWPCKDHLSDKPDSMQMTFNVPDGLSCISNGRLRLKKNLNNGYTRFTWFVSVPIINYDVTFNLADYAHLSEYYINKTDTLTLDYYVLSYNEKRARKQFEEVKPMIACYEKFFGKYPFYRDGYKLLETNYWGMEHQSCVAYGNNYLNNQYGFDFIIIHESAHEWWGNSLSCSDPADMWLHESFATYAEALYLECTRNYKTSIKYLHEQEKRIANKFPIIGPYDVNYEEADVDQYFKGTWMLHTFRHVIDNDSLFFAILKGLQQKFKYSSTNTDEVIASINKLAGKDYAYFFNEYLYKTSPPIFYYKLKKHGSGTELYYRWKGTPEDFNMPVKVTSGVKDSMKTYIVITPGSEWKTIQLDNLNPSDFSVDTDEFYVIPKKEE